MYLIGKTKVKKAKHQLLQRNFASGSVMKPKLKSTKLFGLKGVSHAIKKPKKIAALKRQVSCSGNLAARP